MTLKTGVKAAENSALHHSNKVIKKLFNYIFDQINVALVSIKYFFFQTKTQNAPPPQKKLIYIIVCINTSLCMYSLFTCMCASMSFKVGAFGIDFIAAIEVTAMNPTLLRWIWRLYLSTYNH